MPYRIVDHTADLGIELQAAAPADLLAAATDAVRYIYAGDADLETDAQTVLEVHGAALEELLVSWLNELIFFFDARGEVALGAAGIEVAKKGGGLVARGTVSICRARNRDFTPLTDLKAATYHGLKVRRSRTELTATVVLDT